MRRSFFALCSFLFLAGLLMAWSWNQQSTLEARAVLRIEPGSSASSVLQSDLMCTAYPSLKVMAHPWSWWLRLRHWRYGDYELLPKQRLGSLLKHLVWGREKLYCLTIIPGMQWHQLQASMQALPLQGWDKIDNAFGSLEGYFWPETYCFRRNTKVLHVLQQAHHRFLKEADMIWQQRDAALSTLAWSDFVILASMVERESRDAREQPMVARVMLNRLALGMRLQIDATMAYIAQKEQRLFRAEDLRLTHPYNTYLSSGLPPTPIAYPSASALKAVAHPADGKWLYYRLNCDGSRHHFFETFAQHKKGGSCQKDV